MPGARKIFYFASFFLLVILAAIIHISVLDIFPSPFSHINVIYILMVWLIIFTADIRILWAAAAFGFFLEIFTAMPFGVTSAAFVFSLAAVVWISSHLFTNRSVYMVFLLGGAGMLLYRLAFVVLLIIFNLFRFNYFFSSQEIFADVIWEITLTPAALAVFYFITSSFVRRLRPEYVSLKGKNFYE